MRELAIACFIFVLLAAAALGVERATSMELLWVGGIFVAGGLAFSLPCAVRYHWLLHHVLAPRGALDRYWVLNPTAHHTRLTDGERGQVLPWFYAGALGWGVSIVGCALMGAVVVMEG